MNDHQRLRYSRHILLPELSEQGQEALIDSHVVIVGLGGLGCAVSQYLAASGVGEITLIDGDLVELSNLQRQVAHTTSNLGKNKAISAREHLLAINPEVLIHTVTEFASEDNLQQLAKNCDVLLDCTDNFPVRFMINRVAARLNTPLVSCAAVRWDGQLAVFVPDGACYKCLFTDERPAPDTCAERGVVSPLLGVMGSMQALEAIKLLTGLTDTRTSYWLRFNGLDGVWKKSTLIPDPTCPVCGGAS